MRSRATRFVARDAKATKRPSALITGIVLASSGGPAAPPTGRGAAGSRVTQIDRWERPAIRRLLAALARATEDCRRGERHVAAVPADARHQAGALLLRTTAVHADALDAAAGEIEAIDVRLRAVQRRARAPGSLPRTQTRWRLALASTSGWPLHPFDEARHREPTLIRRAVFSTRSRSTTSVTSGPGRPPATAVERHIAAVGADAGMAAVAVQRAAVDDGAFERDRRRRSIEHVDIGQGVDVGRGEPGVGREGDISAVAADARRAASMADRRPSRCGAVSHGSRPARTARHRARRPCHDGREECARASGLTARGAPRARRACRRERRGSFRTSHRRSSGHRCGRRSPWRRGRSRRAARSRARARAPAAP